MTEPIVVECSDEEEYFDANVEYRVVNGSRVWEPSGEEIVELYNQLDANGCITSGFDWQNPGRISPSEFNSQESTKDNAEDSENKSSDVEKKEAEETSKTEFDFDNAFDETDTPIDTNVKVTVKNRPNQVLKKTNTDLSSVMRNIKKYQQQ